MGSATRKSRNPSTRTCAYCGLEPVNVVTKYPLSIARMCGLAHSSGGWHFCDAVAATILARRSGARGGRDLQAITSKMSARVESFARRRFGRVPASAAMMVFKNMRVESAVARYGEATCVRLSIDDVLLVPSSLIREEARMVRMSVKIKLVAVLSYIAFCGASLAQDEKPPDEDIIQLVERYDSAWNSKDAAAVQGILATDYIYFSSKGATESRQHMLDMLLSPKYTLASAQRTEMAVHRTSSTAVVSSRWKGRGTYDGREFYDDQRCSIVLGLEKQGWRVLSEHCTQIAVP